MTSVRSVKALDAGVQLAEAAGVSKEGWADAVWRAVSSVLNPTRRLVSLEVVRSNSPQADGTPFRVVVRVAFAPVAKQPNRSRRPLAAS